MSFFKYHNYNTVSSSVINFTFHQNGNTFNVGSVDRSASMTVLDVNGGLILNKIYSFRDKLITCSKIMPLKSDYMLLGFENSTIPFLMLVSADGSVKWYKSFPDANVRGRLYATTYEDRVFVTYYDVKLTTSYIIAVDQNARVLSKKEIAVGGAVENPFEVTGITMYGRMLALCGNHTVKSQVIGAFLTADLNLNLSDSRYTYTAGGGTPMSLDGIYYANNKLFVSGLWNQLPMLMLAYEQLGISYRENYNKAPKYVFGDNFFLIYNNQNEIIKSDYGFNHEYMKRMDVKSFSIDQIYKDEVVLHGIDGERHFSGFFGNQFDNCKTTPLQPWRISYFEQMPEVAGFKLNEVPYKEYTPKPASSNFGYKNEGVCDTGGSTIDFNDLSGLQTPNFYVQAAGSKGEDSTKGIHLRWSLGGKLGENHLPKGNDASTSYNFNKPNDFVKLYRTPYVKSVFSLDFSVAPQMVDDSQKMWVYKFNNNTRLIYVYFKNKNVYTQVRQIYNPLTQPLKFIEKYGSELIEVQSKTDLFFAASLKLNDVQGYTNLQLEALSVTDNNSVSQQHLTYRKEFYGLEAGSNYFNAENGKTIRFKAITGFVTAVNFEFYSDFIINTNQSQAWKLMGEFSLTSDTNEVFNRLDPLPDSNPVHGAWLRYNDKAFVNTENYKAKWEHASQGPLDRDILTVVKNYVSLSNAQQNPKANETLDLNLGAGQNDPNVVISTDPVQDGQTEVSNLDILNIASLDYHVARMLGLGYLDINTDVEGKEFIYIAEYFTNKNLDINSSDKTYQLLSMSLPVSTEIERLSLPVDLLKLAKGMEGTNPNSANLYNSEGYSHDGKYRYISIYNNQIPDFQVNPTFFDSSYKFDASSFTNPVYAGLESRLVKPGEADSYIWTKPELCHDPQYLNIDSASDSFETLPIQIPDGYTPLYMHRQDKSGTYFYKGYGINWFSRAQNGEKELSIDTDIKPANRLLPPSGTNAFNIQKEYPLTFTTQNEQERLKAITDDDKTLVRLAYDYHIYQDMIGYSIPFDSAISTSTYVQDPESLFPDNKEVFADDVEIFYRNYTPKIISAQAYEVLPHTNQLMAIIKTRNYSVPGSGAQNNGVTQPSIPTQTLKSEIPAGTTVSDYIGGIFLMDSDSYIINGIDQTPTGLHFTVFKKAASEAIIAGTTPLIDQTSLTLPVINPATEGVFNVTENMQNTPTWGVKNPNSLKVKIGTNDWTVHREVIETPLANGGTQRYLEKSRGFWKTARVNKHFEELTVYQNSQGTVIDYPNKPLVHKGVYKITFPGFKMAQHSQFNAGSHSVEWQNGIVRMFTNKDYNNGNPVEGRSVFKIVRTENIGTNNDLVLYIYDENFIIEEDANHQPEFQVPSGVYSVKDSDPVVGTDLMINYYPSYKVLLYKNIANNLTQDAILPGDDEDVRYSVFGLRSVDNDTLDMQGAKYKSKFGVLAIMFANKIIAPKQPKQPTGSKYATRPDKFGKSTYSFITEYTHKPYSVQFFRANNALLMGALYRPGTVREIMARLNELGGTDEVFFNDRWINFMDFDMLTNPVSTEYTEFPDVGELRYTMPIPDSEDFLLAINAFIKAHNDHFKLTLGQNPYSQPLDETKWKNGEYLINQIVIKAVPNQADELRLGHFIKERIFNCFLPLTEVPMIYQHIKNMDYSSMLGHRPKNKKQNIRDASGYLLPPTHQDFDMAPMAAIYSSSPNHSTLFTDFTLDGASDNFYFYGVRELGNQMQMGEFSTFLGPIKLVNTNPAEPPKILSLLPIVENVSLGISTKVRIEVNSYTDVHKINTISVYRSTNRLDAESILSMKHIKTVNIADVEIDTANNSWVVYDEFEDMDDKPYGDALFYRVVVSRKVEYNTMDYAVTPPASQVVEEEAPSLPSKITVSTLVENYNPPTPVLSYHSEPVTSDVINWVILSWEQVCYKGKYHLYKMSPSGNWKEMARIDTDGKDISKANLYVFANNPTTNTDEWLFKETFDMTGNEFFLPVEKLGMDPMKIKDSDGNMLYHHFKIVAQNTSNMLSTEEKILTIYKEETWTDIGGISHDGTDGMIVQGTFIVRP
ncbi:hypothetical protein [Chryseobacterium sp.]|uniref:hypothetical protein n=1 Tax=Chryseobacterium sp. TaxID=1871047 RepID=UPI0025B82DB9|nr:hypothetical protein [Chryseobacterium sp.]MBV8328828.1 hypothetical protein [Chryseobacterium sp.]